MPRVSRLLIFEQLVPIVPDVVRVEVSAVIVRVTVLVPIYGVRRHTASAFRVAASTTPVAVTLCARCQRKTACCVVMP
jgi:hypothetical protein